MKYARSLCLIVIASLVSTLQAATLQSDTTPSAELVVESRSAKTFRIIVEQSFGEATATLPFGQTIRALLKSTSLREVDDDADITIVVKAVGGGLSANYGALGANHRMAGVRYTGAVLSGSLRVTVRSGMYCEVSFKKRVDPPDMLMIDPQHASTSSDAPFDQTFDVFVTKLCDIALDLFGVPSLLSALKDTTYYVRKSVVETLGRTSDPTVLDALISMLGDPSFDVRSATAKTLTNMVDARVSDALVKCLKSSSIDVRTMAAQILSERKDCCPVEPLLVAFDDRRGGNYYGIDAFRSRVALALGATKDPLALRRLIVAVRDGSEGRSVLSSIAEALGKFQDKTAAETLIAILENAKEHESVRSSAARSLGLTRDPRAVALLIQTLMDPQRDVRGAAAFALRFFREARVVEALISAITKRDLNDPPNALESLKKLTGQKLQSTGAWQKWWQDNKGTFEQQKQ